MGRQSVAPPGGLLMGQPELAAVQRDGAVAPERRERLALPCFGLGIGATDKRVRLAIRLAEVKCHLCQCPVQHSLRGEAYAKRRVEARNMIESQSSSGSFCTDFVAHRLFPLHPIPAPRSPHQSKEQLWSGAPVGFLIWVVSPGRQH
jgi:hypothetical protein